MGVGGGAVGAVGGVGVTGGVEVGGTAVAVAVALGTDAVEVNVDGTGDVLPVERHAELSMTQIMRHEGNHFFTYASPTELASDHNPTLQRTRISHG